MLANRLVTTLAGCTLLLACQQDPSGEVDESETDASEVSETDDTAETGEMDETGESGDPEPDTDTGTPDVSDPEPSVTPEEVEAACRDTCETERTLECFPHQSITADQCTDACVFTFETYGDFCGAEWVDRLTCAAEAYECIDGDLHWSEACSEQVGAWDACLHGIECGLACDARSEAGCANYGECLASCEAERATLSFGCQIEFDEWQHCVALAEDPCDPDELCAEFRQAYEACE